MRSESLLKNNLSKQKVLVLGAGYLGGKITSHLSSLGYETELVSSSKVNYHNRKELWHLLLNSEPTIVINCSGFTGRPNIDEAEVKKSECWQYNTVSPVQVTELCSDFGVKHIHVSSGCIFTGYDKTYTEEDVPNFGLWNESSFYSKSKHAYETLTTRYPVKILRIRMPISGMDSERCYLSKIVKYDKLINYVNSKTSISELCIFIDRLLAKEDLAWDKQDIYNVVNPNPLTTVEVVEFLKLAGKHNPNWKIVPMDEIPIVAPRSNCVLDNTKADSIYKFKPEGYALLETLGVELPESLTSTGTVIRF